MEQESLWTTFKRIFTACLVMAISQLGGFNTLVHYSATLFSIVGFSNATAVAITVSGTNFIFSIVNLVLVDKFGRRRLLTITVLGMSICMLVAAVSFHYIPIDLKTLSLETDNVGWPGDLVLVCIIVYVACFSSVVATIAWIGTELIPLEVRALGTMLNTVTCWSTNIIIASTFLSMMKGMTPLVDSVPSYTAHSEHHFSRNRHSEGLKSRGKTEVLAMLNLFRIEVVALLG